MPLCVSRRRLLDRKTLPRATCDWVLDSGGFSELSLTGGWSISPREYVRVVRRYQQEIGRMVWAAPMDWMCEPGMLARTGKTVAEHQALTVLNFVQLRDLAPDCPFIPVLQGWACDDYRRHADAYGTAGVDLGAAPVVGLGSVCRRQHMGVAEQIVRSLQGLRLHGFGFKLTGLERVGGLLVSSDSMAWSIHARYRLPLPGCSHKNCANCSVWALQWRQKVLAAVNKGEASPEQLLLWN